MFVEIGITNGLGKCCLVSADEHPSGLCPAGKQIFPRENLLHGYDNDDTANVSYKAIEKWSKDINYKTDQMT